MRAELPIEFPCSGRSEAGQLANKVALELNRRGMAERSCLVGVGTATRRFLKQRRDCEIWIIDGCPIECSMRVFHQVQEHTDVHIRLHALDVRKHAPPPAGMPF